MGIVLIIIGVIVWFYAAKNHQSAEHNPHHDHRPYEAHPVLGCVPFIIAFSLIGGGIYLLISS